MSNVKPKARINDNLQPDVKAKYTVIRIKSVRFETAKYGVVDLRKLTLAQAEKLVKEGFPYLKEREQAAAAGTTGKGKS